MADLDSRELRGVVEGLLREGIAAHRAGDGARARGIYREVIGKAPGNADGHHLDGVIGVAGAGFLGGD